MQKKEVDVYFSLIVLAMMFFWLVMISSVSVYSSYRITSGYVEQWLLDAPNNSLFLLKTVTNVIGAIAVMIIFSKIPYQIFEKYAKIFFWTVVVMLVMALLPIVGHTFNGASGWVGIKGFFVFQPAEFVKPAIILMLAYFLRRRHSVMQDLHAGVIPFVKIVSIPIILLMLQPDFGSVLIITPIVLFMYFAGNGNVKYFAISAALAIFGALMVYGIGKTSIWQEMKIGYISQRIDNFLRSNQEIALMKNNDKWEYQLRNALIAIGSGGPTGLWFGNSIQKFWYLPEPYGDFIFAVSAEELWFVGWVILIGIYLFLAHRGYNIARSVKDLFWRYLAFGITTWIVVQAFINIGVNLNVVPLTGITLPFVSYGWSSLISLGCAAGVLLSISRHMEIKPQNLSDALRSGRKVKL